MAVSFCQVSVGPVWPVGQKLVKHSALSACCGVQTVSADDMHWYLLTLMCATAVYQPLLKPIAIGILLFQQLKDYCINCWTQLCHACMHVPTIYTDCTA